MKVKISFNLVWFVIIQVVTILLKRAGKILWAWPWVFIPTYIVLAVLLAVGVWYFNEWQMDRKIYKAEIKYRTDWN